VTVEAVVKVQDRVEVPDPVTLVGVRVHAALFAVRLTTPLKPWRPVTVIVEVPAALTFSVTAVGLAAIVKS